MDRCPKVADEMAEEIAETDMYGARGGRDGYQQQLLWNEPLRTDQLHGSKQCKSNESAWSEPAMEWKQSTVEL
ncbi:hypothetical protein THAOC_19246 [Thalassiosira oceanica]|uniref:Uncharacterized protein n=1 Tax=Thalassiosira oceanica TaxID=159749 RepID=K0S673_THAOC|nr:hypothetical protein THAOC_19246 [Thalassiosira oceanica]|eukprot:EJK60409.1 hypothetical protein THAOC_19246 [Thalassiosira oceanica]